MVGDPMEKTTLDALEWNLAKGDILTPGNDSAYKVTLTIRRRFQFSSALKRMSTISSLPGGKLVAAVKGAPETIRTMLAVVPKDYDETYKWYTRQGSRVLALGMKEMDALRTDEVRGIVCDSQFRLTGLVDQQTSQVGGREPAYVCWIPGVPLSAQGRRC